MSKATTIQLHDRREFRRAIMRLELEYDEIYEAEAVDVHEALVQIGINNPEMLLKELQKIQQDRD